MIIHHTNVLTCGFVLIKTAGQLVVSVLLDFDAHFARDISMKINFLLLTNTFLTVPML